MTRARHFIYMGLLALPATGCSYGGINGYGGDFVELRGTPEGLMSLSDYQSGLITNGKASPDTQTEYWETRRHQALTRLKTFAAKNPAKGVK